MHPRIHAAIARIPSENLSTLRNRHVLHFNASRTIKWCRCICVVTCCGQTRVPAVSSKQCPPTVQAATCRERNSSCIILYNPLLAQEETPDSTTSAKQGNLGMPSRGHSSRTTPPVREEFRKEANFRILFRRTSCGHQSFMTSNYCRVKEG